MSNFLNDYSTQKSNKIDMKLTGTYIVSRNIELPKDMNKYLDHYPSDEMANKLKTKLAKHLSVDVERIILGAGSNGIMQNLMRIFFKDKGELIVPKFSFSQPEYAVLSLGGSVKKIEHNENFSINFSKIKNAISNDTRALFLCNPNNPTGIYESQQKFIDLANSTSIPVVVSEASIEYTQEKSLLDYELPKNLIVLRSFSKAYGLSGLRVGYGYMHPNYISIYEENTTQFEISALSLLVASKMVNEKSVNENICKIKEQCLYLRSSLKELGISTTDANSGCFMSTECFDKVFFDELESHDVSVVKVESDTKDKFYFRVAVQDKITNEKFIKAISLCDWRSRR